MCVDFHERAMKAEQKLIEAENKNEGLYQQLLAAQRVHNPAEDRYESEMIKCSA